LDKEVSDGSDRERTVMRVVKSAAGLDVYLVDRGYPGMLCASWRGYIQPLDGFGLYRHQTKCFKERRQLSGLPEDERGWRSSAWSEKSVGSVADKLAEQACGGSGGNECHIMPSDKQACFPGYRYNQSPWVWT
jgi:hypothetical protein